MSTQLAVEDQRALSMLRRVESITDRSAFVRRVSALGSDLYALAEELSGTPDGADEEWLSSDLLMRTESELLRRIGGWANLPSYVDTLCAGRAS